MWDKLWNSIQSNKKVGLTNATPAQILEKILTDSWTLQEEDKDMIVMYINLATKWQKKNK
jgi:hypothetical protein